jgi:CO/xanthine dehydrogenase Mo-binding subunit
VADVGTVIHPHALGGQVLGRSMLGIAHAIGQHWVYDQHYGVPLAKRFYQNKPPTILDAPQKMAWDALNIPIPRRRSAHAASANRRWRRAVAPC